MALEATLWPVVPVLGVASGDTAGLLTWVAILIGAVMVLSLVVVAARRWYLAQRQPDSARAAAGLMDQLRQMHDDGRLSDEEFRAAKAGLARGMERAIAETRGGGGARSVADARGGAARPDNRGGVTGANGSGRATAMPRGSGQRGGQGPRAGGAGRAES